jgi:hypothetical protein
MAAGDAQIFGIGTGDRKLAPLKIDDTHRADRGTQAVLVTCFFIHEK